MTKRCVHKVGGGNDPIRRRFFCPTDPFNTDGRVDVQRLRRVIDLYLGSGINGLTALGVTSEVARLSDRERREVLGRVLEHVNGRVPVVAGAMAAGVATCIEYTKSAHRAGARGVMISPPRMPKLNSESVVGYFSSVADAADIPIVVQDYPPISGGLLLWGPLLCVQTEAKRAGISNNSFEFHLLCGIKTEEQRR